MAYIGHVVEIPIGQGGLTGTKNQALITPDQLIVATNVAFDTGTVKKEGGATKYNSTAITGTPDVIGGYDWWPDTSTQRMIVVTSAGNILKDSGGGTFGTTLASGLTVTDTVPMFVEGGKEAAANNRKLFIFTGQNQVKVLSGDGATVANITTPPADWTSSFPTCGTNHEGRLWGAGNSNDAHRVYYSTTTNHEDLTGAGSGSISIFPGEGEKIVSIVSFKGLLVVWKFPLGVYYVDTTDPSTANWKVKKLSSGTGGVSPLGFVIVDDDIIFIDASGNFQLLSTVTEFGDMSSNNLSTRAQMNTFVRDNINFSGLGKCRAVFYGFKREVHFALYGSGGTNNNRRIVLDLNARAPRFRFSDRDVNHTLWLRKDTDNVPKLLMGSTGGFVYKLDQTTTAKDGTGYNSSFQSSHIDFSHIDPILATKQKNGQFLELVVEPTGNWNLAVDIYWDNTYTQTVYFNMGTGGAALGSFTLGTDALGGDAVLNRKQRITGSGRRLSIACSNNGANEGFSVARFYVHFTVGDERNAAG